MLKAGNVAAPFTGSIISSLTGIPGIAEAFAGLFSVITPPLEKRKAEWMRSINERLVRLESAKDGFTLKDLSNKPFFIDVFMHAYQIALGNHREEKLEALRNAVVNTAMPTFPEDDIYISFLNLIDSFTSSHIRVLMILNKIELRVIDGRLDVRMIRVPALDKVLHNFQELKADRSFASMIIKDLNDHGLVDTEKAPEIIHEDKNRYESYTTKLGKRFVDYISESS